jgi:soluble lytic murein transglycosylase-like protein
MEQAQRYEHGIGTAQDLNRALTYYCRASEAGDRDAQYHIGWLYLTGRLGAVDEVLAAAWFQLAANNAHQRAYQRLQQLDAVNRSLEQAPECRPGTMLTARYLPARQPGYAQTTTTAHLKATIPRIIETHPLDRSDIVALVRRLAPDYQLNPELVLAMIAIESNFNPQAQSHRHAQGLMQLMPDTAQRFGVTDVWDPLANLRGGMAYLRWLLNQFDNDVSLALAGYNAGEQAVIRHGGIPPFPETQQYVKKVLAQLP